MMTLYKYHGAGNDFLIGDNRDGAIVLDTAKIQLLCDRHLGFGSDGLMLLENSDTYDFAMKFYNPDGSSGMMCGNGGRCIVAFAADKGYKSFNFDAPDGPHQAQIIQKGNPKIVRLRLKDVKQFEKISKQEYFIDTGTRHFIRLVDNIENYDVSVEGRKIRFDKRFAPIGTNANFMCVEDNKLKVRTYEKGVEDETLACGTGIVASAIAAYMSGIPYFALENGVCKYNVLAKISSLSVEFRPIDNGMVFTDIWLTGPAEYVGDIIVK